MPRKIKIQLPDGSAPLLSEVAAEDELQLQELVKREPDLLPIEEFEMTGPLMVVGRETALPSGAVDLVALTRSGELLIIEFKTGPQNSDFRSALSQLIDYGSHVWGMSLDEFEQSVAARYFASAHCSDDRVRGLSSLSEAATRTWSGLSDEELLQLQDRLGQQLLLGGFHYILVAQRFTPTIERTIEYLSSITRAPKFYAVELIRFTANGLSAFESRTVYKPGSIRGTSPATYGTDEEFLEQIQPDQYRDLIRDLLQACRGLGYRLEFGTLGVSIRLPTSDMAEPLTIGWVFPPGRSGWMGLKDLTLGIDTSSAEKRPSAKPALDAYLSAIEKVDGAEPAQPGTVKSFHFAPDAVQRSHDRIVDALASLIAPTSPVGS